MKRLHNAMCIHDVSKNKNFWRDFFLLNILLFIYLLYSDVCSQYCGWIIRIYIGIADSSIIEVLNSWQIWYIPIGWVWNCKCRICGKMWFFLVTKLSHFISKFMCCWKHFYFFYIIYYLKLVQHHVFDKRFYIITIILYLSFYF